MKKEVNAIGDICPIPLVKAKGEESGAVRQGSFERILGNQR